MKPKFFFNTIICSSCLYYFELQLTSQMITSAQNLLKLRSRQGQNWKIAKMCAQPSNMRVQLPIFLPKSRQLTAISKEGSFFEPGLTLFCEVQLLVFLHRSYRARCSRDTCLMQRDYELYHIISTITGLTISSHIFSVFNSSCSLLPSLQ